MGDPWFVPCAIGQEVATLKEKSNGKNGFEMYLSFLMGCTGNERAEIWIFDTGTYELCWYGLF